MKPIKLSTIPDAWVLGKFIGLSIGFRIAFQWGSFIITVSFEQSMTMINATTVLFL